MKNDQSKQKYNRNDRRILSNIILGRKGGPTTVRIIDELLTKPYNVNQLSQTLHLDYKTVRHHINIIYGCKFLEKEDLGYCVLYYPSNRLINCLKEYYNIKGNLKK